MAKVSDEWKVRCLAAEKQAALLQATLDVAQNVAQTERGIIMKVSNVAKLCAIIPGNHSKQST